MVETLNIGIAGLGTVGAETFRLLHEQEALYTARSGKKLQVVAVSARDKSRDRGIDVSEVEWVEDAAQLAENPDIDLIVEMIGGSEGVAHILCHNALDKGKSVVTANKALIAHHGGALATLAESKGGALAFEAAVAGGIPILKCLKEGLAANQFTQVSGILNGTCNYITTAMEETGRDFDDILAEAQELGYAEADPTFDVDGIDAAHKLTILSSLAFGIEVDFSATQTEGIRDITVQDITYAREMGYSIKLLGLCYKKEGKIFQAVHPCLIPVSEPIASVNGVNNAVAVKGNAVGDVMLQGPGAGAGATASSVIADIIDIAAGRMSPAFTTSVSNLATGTFISLDNRVGEYYLRIPVTDCPGVLAKITDILKEASISTKSLLQKAEQSKNAVQIVIVTHDAVEANVKKALALINQLDEVLEDVQLIRVVS